MTKYCLLKDEVHRMWNTSVSIVPFVIGTLGIVKQGQADIVASLPGSCSIFEIQKTVLQAWINGNFEESFEHWQTKM